MEKINKFRNLKKSILERIKEEPELSCDSGIFMSLLNNENCHGVSALYESALNRGDWMATEYVGLENFHPDSDFFRKQIHHEYHIWFVFRNKQNEIVGSTKLGLCANGSIVIDETQLHPKKGQGRHIMQNYFKIIVPILNHSGFEYWTEFILSIGSRSLRNTLLNDLGMCATGIRPLCYKNTIKKEPVSCLLAYGPGEKVKSKISKFLDSKPPGDVADFLDIICGGSPKISPPKPHHDHGHIKELIIPIKNSQKIDRHIKEGYKITSFNPFDEMIHLSRPTSNTASQLWYLEKEKNVNVKKIARYILNSGEPLRKT